MGKTIKKKKFVLVVEDDAYYSKIYKEKIAKEGFDVATAADGAEGLEIVKKRIPDLVILDILMPKMDGFDFLQKIRQNKKLKNLKVLVMTNLDQKADVSKAFELGAKHYFVKSDISIDELMNKVKEGVK